MADTGCCGSGFEENKASIIGLITLCLPLILISLALIIIFSIASILIQNTGTLKAKVAVILKANLNLIHSAPIAPKTRCFIAGRLFAFSPIFSGIFYRCFNISLLISLWGIIIFFYYQIANLIGK